MQASVECSRVRLTCRIPAALHLLGAHGLTVSAHELALPVGVDPVEQRLIDHAQRSGHRINSFPTLDKLDRFLLEFERVVRP